MDIHAVTAAGLLEKFLGPSHDHSQDDLVSADGTLKRADVSQRPNQTWHGPDTSSAMSDQRTSASKVSTAAFRQSNLRTHELSVLSEMKSDLHIMTWAPQLWKGMTLPFPARMHLCFQCIAAQMCRALHAVFSLVLPASATVQPVHNRLHSLQQHQLCNSKPIYARLGHLCDHCFMCHRC